ncbi:MAG TPA: T9SS type A sorting domain-containing protein, partial [Flavobacterium sp.]|uniref:T9SS type A sorting domain-containing protein n=1 Tax=Flavobacterium sp. TaxID=239 RepID=UPI002ED1A8DD
SSNRLTNLDVAVNKALTSLNCSNNQLNNLDIATNTALISLECGYNLLNILNVSRNTALKTLDCDYNLLTTLDVTKNIALTSLICGLNKLGSLDISKNTALTLLNCTINELTSLDVSKNLFLNSLRCNSNKFTSLDVSKNTALTTLYCYNNPLLNSLNLKNGKNSLIGTGKIKIFYNPNLSCIQVDDVAYSNANWSAAKDATASYSLNCTSLGISESVFNTITVYPNPSKGEIYIDNVTLEKATVYDALGKLVKTTKFVGDSNSNTINLAGSPSGIYYIYLERQGITVVKKIILE